MKTYSSKANARRAMIRELMKNGESKPAAIKEFEAEFTIEKDGDFGFYARRIQKQASKGGKTQPQPEAPSKSPEEKKAEATSLEGVLRKSQIDMPCNRVFEIASEMFAENPEVRRRDVIARCVEQGVAYYTARTQYQQWKKANDSSKK